ncbi:TlpA family protein disulfide reductase [Nocardioides sp.]|uniref:TlpA family protein disulfide reductase n=1 Tax=Nocardioides sp. TaxID=35761 RepID=UPI003529D27D
MTAGQWVLLSCVVLALAIGGYRALSDGRFRGTHRVRGVDEADEAHEADRTAEPGRADAADAPTAPGAIDLAALGEQLGERATLLQFSSAFCAPCRVTRRTLAEVADLVPGVTHVEVDAEHHLDLVRRLGVLRTPTTLILDASGREVTRAAGAPRRDQVLAALGEPV